MLISQLFDLVYNLHVMWDTVAGVVVVFSWTWNFMFYMFKNKISKLFVKGLATFFFSFFHVCFIS
jgi:hypothetical protein